MRFGISRVRHPTRDVACLLNDRQFALRLSRHFHSHLRGPPPPQLPFYLTSRLTNLDVYIMPEESGITVEGSCVALYSTMTLAVPRVLFSTRKKTHQYPQCSNIPDPVGKGYKVTVYEFQCAAAG